VFYPATLASCPNLKAVQAVISAGVTQQSFTDINGCIFAQNKRIVAKEGDKRTKHPSKPTREVGVFVVLVHQGAGERGFWMR